MTRILKNLRIILSVALVAAGLIAAGFVIFANQISGEQTHTLRKADGIVVLTGGTARIEAGVDLLAKGRAKRLLISGVNHSTTREELEKLFPKGRGLFRCCIDLDRRALNTIGNATETKTWAQARGFKSLIVVTSSYHMPRTMVELQRVMPEIEMVPFAVAPSYANLNKWWSDSDTARLLLVEYFKYIPALVRSKAERLAGVRGSDTSALGAAAERP